MARIPFALQLHSIQDECVANLPRALEQVAAMGYEGVEFAGYYGYQPAELRQMLDDLGLVVVGTHTWYQHVPLVGPGAEAYVVDAVAESRVLGNEILIEIGDVPFAPQARGSAAGWIERAAQYNELARRLAQDNMWVGYHNHAFEFEEVVEGERIWDLLSAHLAQEVLIELDTGSTFRGGGDVLAVLEQCAGRVRTVHLKAHSRTLGTRPLIGEDDLPWSEILGLCQAVAGTQWYIVEYESDGYPRLEAVRRCLDALKAMVG
jgi:sugar phosphate isomerase/epimerase